MVKEGQIYEAKDGRRVRILLVRQNGTAHTENTKTGRQGDMLTENFGRSPWRLLEGVK